MALRRLTVIAGLILLLGLVNWSIAQKETLLRDGAPLLVELAPRDPRSIIQGDYMTLDYRIARDLVGYADWPRDGQIVVTADEHNVASFVRRHEGAPLAAGEHLLVYRRRAGRFRIGADAFFFQEGQAAIYQPARFGELRVDASGESLLIGLRDSRYRPLVSDPAGESPQEPDQQ
jgi:uncharacterized membrane-anchored protein